MLFRKSLAECSVESPSTLLAYGALASIAARSACRPDTDDKTSCAAGAWHGHGLVCYARSSEGMGESGGRKVAYQSYGLGYFGQTVNMAARLQGQAEAGDLLLPEDCPRRPAAGSGAPASPSATSRRSRAAPVPVDSFAPA